MTNDRLADLAAAGVSTWLDDLSRERLRSGNLKSLITDKHVVGVTTNPTAFAAALANGEAYDEQVRELAKSDASTEDAVRAITVADVQHACGVFHDTWEATGGVDGRVSLEVDPRLPWGLTSPPCSWRSRTTASTSSSSPGRSCGTP